MFEIVLVSFNTFALSKIILNKLKFSNYFSESKKLVFILFVFNLIIVNKLHYLERKDIKSI